jgi:hypothetical protein
MTRNRLGRGALGSSVYSGSGRKLAALSALIRCWERSSKAWNRWRCALLAARCSEACDLGAVFKKGSSIAAVDSLASLVSRRSGRERAASDCPGFIDVAELALRRLNAGLLDRLPFRAGLKVVAALPRVTGR